MENEIKELEERLRAVEGYIKMLIGGAIVLAVCALAFLGIEYWRVPAAVQSAIRERIDQTTLSRITDANTLAENLLKNARNNQSWDENTRSGFVVVGETLICFGTHGASPAELPYTRKFDVTFPRQYATAPSVTITPICDSSGFTFGIYKDFLPTPTGCSGYLNEASLKQEPAGGAKVKVSYVAIGKPAK
jgi:hypothetical protein